MAQVSRNIRVGDKLWNRAARKAKRQDRSISEVIRAFLVEWTEDESDDGDDAH